MEIELTNEEEVPPVTKPKLNFLSTATSSNEKSLDEWFAAADDPATTDQDKNTLVAKNVTTSSSNNLPSLHNIPATSTAGLHHPSVQDVGNTDRKKAFSAITSADHAQASSSGVAPVLAAREEHRAIPLHGNNDGDSDSSDVSGLEFFVDKSPDRD